MSTPTRQFHRLSIGQNMPAESTREAHTPLHDPPDEDEEDPSNEEEDDSSESEMDSHEDPSPSTITSQSRITYDLSSLDAEARANALVGLSTQFEVVDCRASHSGYDFQLLERPQIHLGQNPPSCTCLAFQSNPQVACQHLFWIFDQLHLCFVSTPTAVKASLSHDGHPRVNQRLEELLAGQLDAIADRLNWQCLRIEGDGSHRGMTRAEKVRDIFSAFSKVFPEDFRQDLTETTERRTPEQCVVQGDLEATMFRLAVHDDSVFSSLCKAMPSGACASIYFDKVQEQTRRLLADFDRYCMTGRRPVDPSHPGGGAVEVNEYRLSRRTLRLGRPMAREGAAKVLVSLLDAVASRNKDPLEGNQWGRTSFHGEDEDQRNLYHLLIGSEAMDLNADAELFVLDALGTLHPSYLHLYRKELRSAQSKIEVNRAPRTYLLHLGQLVRTAESNAAGQMGSGQKRPAGNGNPGSVTKRNR
ncbi:hypothetical protein N7470_009438 [Penicillium chermesinum]|nr:hypothetical protein N7470_009438 [Penicillium chermesinum]